MTSQYHIVLAIAPNPCILQKKQSSFWRLLAKTKWELENEFQMWLSLQKTALSSFMCFMSSPAGLPWVIPSSKASFPHYIAYTGFLTNTSNPVLLKNPEISQKGKENKRK